MRKFKKMVCDNNPLVSLIIPAYNVSNYLDRAVESVINQSYSNIEIIIIDDGSTDDTGIICDTWGRLDKRVIVIHQNNQGLSYTRNVGVKKSRGEFFSFVDSDDYIDSEYIELMLESALKNDADLVTCDICTIEKDGSSRYIKCGVKQDENYIKRLLLNSNTAAWNKLYKKGYWVDAGLEFPLGFAEDTALFAPIILNANKVVSVNKDLYYYDKTREGSITKDISRRKTYTAALQNGVQILKNQQKWLENKEVLLRYYMKWSCNALVPILGKTNYEEYGAIRKMIIDFLETNFEIRVARACIWGSYNLGRIVRETTLFADPWLRFQYSTIKSIIDFSGDKDTIIVNNLSYRDFMIQRDKNKSFWTVLEEEKPEYLIIDFLEERDRIKDYLRNYGDMSNASIFETYIKDVLETFANEIIKYLDEKKIVIVESYLATYYLEKNKMILYDSAKEITRINEILKLYYETIIEKLPNAFMLSVPINTMYYTDSLYEYGCYPWHLNDDINNEIADLLVNYVEK